MNLIINIIISLVSLLPRSWNLFIGRQMGTLIYLMGLRKQVATINMKIAFPNLNNFDVEIRIAGAIIHFGTKINVQKEIATFSLERGNVFSLPGGFCRISNN